MYSVKPYLDNFTVKPAKIIYNMPSYHQSTTGEFYDYNGSGNNENLNKEQRKEIYFEPICAQKIAAFSESGLNQKEHVQPESDENDQLVKRLKALSSRLDKFIATGSGKNAANSSTPNKKGSPPTPVMESGQNVQTNEQKGTELKKNEVKNADNKQDKKAERKEKREAAISAAKNKIPTQAISVDQQPKTKVVSSSTPTETELAQFVLKAPPANSPFLLHAKVQPTASVFPVHNYGIDPKQFADLKIKWTLKGRDKVLAKLLRKLGEKRRVQFVDGPMKKDNANGLVVYIEEATTDGKEEIKLEINGNQLPGELVCWKSLGTMLGLYSPDDVLVSAKTDKWLLMAATANSRQHLEKLTRQMNAFLGENDFLSSLHAVCLADIVVRSLFVHQQSGDLLSWQQVKAPNNVQLWIKRVDEALA